MEIPCTIPMCPSAAREDKDSNLYPVFRLLFSFSGVAKWSAKRVMNGRLNLGARL